MRPLYRTLPRDSTAPSHVCLSCRLARQRRLRHTSAPEASSTARPPGLGQGDENVGQSSGESAASSVLRRNALYGAQNAEEGQEYNEATEPTASAPRTSQQAKLRYAFAVRHASDRRQLSTEERASSQRATPMRAYHTSRPMRQEMAAAAAKEPQPFVEFSGFRLKKPPIEKPPVKPNLSSNGIRAQLREWQELHGHEATYDHDVIPDDEIETGDISNNMSRLPDEQTALRNTAAENEEDQREAMSYFTQASSDEPSSSEFDPRFLNTGDLVEIEFTQSERESIVAVFVRRIGALAQFYTMQGRWVHSQEKRVQYSVPGWVSKEMIEPLLEHLPSPEDVESDLEALMDEAFIKDLSVPRHVAAPLVSRMVQFHAEAQEIYRKHARTLDNAHNLLAHETDLRYGSLVSAATSLLKIPAEKLPVTALYAVRQALSHAGFAFDIDRRSHRRTGYLQIRSKEQVKMVGEVRGWIREWQDDLAKTTTMTEQQQRKHHRSRSAQHVYSFLDKARKIVLKSREDREPTAYGCVGPSKVRIPITKEQDSVRATKGDEFSSSGVEIVRFIEAWSISRIFDSLPQIQALPPLLLQATGLYDDMARLSNSTGMVFLQELGTVLPYENRIRFDQHLLLPSSQHSRPLQNLMDTLLNMQASHNFVDSMAELRHDWGQLPVYCIDAATAHEIDDGLSIEPAPVGEDGHKEWWVHIHIANPTAFFTRDHPMAKMARHMGETIYMPERTYMMLPRWSTDKHFSLGKNRPCLTFSARMNEAGQTLERKIRPGLLRKVFRLTQPEVAELMGATPKASDTSADEVVLTVGGDPPPPRARRSQVDEITPEMTEQLKTLRHLAQKRQAGRSAAGGLFFDTHKPDVSVWQNYRSPGLAWDHPYRKGGRHMEGDPVIQMRTKPLKNWFMPMDNQVDTLVREMMLLACEVAATWCEERAIPAVFRGSLPRPDKMASDVFYREVLSPAIAQGPGGEYPMHLGLQYLETFGSTGLSTRPFKHKILGMDAYGKVTSPLRRYGDMIVHWQIEAALRQEAALGQSLIVPPDQDHTTVDRNFLPFSTPVLDTILVGLQPRENVIMKAKSYAEVFWINMLLFRGFHFNETPVPFGPDGRTVNAYIHLAVNTNRARLAVMIRELNVVATMEVPESVVGSSIGMGAGGVAGLGAARQGDLWECEVVGINVFHRIINLRPRRLVERM